MDRRLFSIDARLVGAALLGALALTGTGEAYAAPVLTTLLSFDGADGSIAIAPLVLDPAGNLYGTTLFGGNGGEFGQGVVFELSGPGHTQVSTLAAFNGGNGAAPSAGLTLDPSGRLFGSTQSGGSSNDGTIFQLSGRQDRALTTLATFSGANGANPLGGLTLAGAGQGHTGRTPYTPGTLFGTTQSGGAHGDGTVFELSGPFHTVLKTLYSFDIKDGSQPGSTLVADQAGNLYGTTFTGGPGGNAIYGTVFELSGPAHDKLTTLVAFNVMNGANPVGGLTFDAAGNLYGTTQYGGTNGGGGTIFELSGPDHRHFKTLASFGNSDPNGAVPQGTLLIDAAGNLYGTTNGGGDEFGGGAFLGAVFKLSADHTTLKPLYAFQGQLDGDIPQAGLVADAAGNLYGTTSSGGADGAGVVFELSGTGFVTGSLPKQPLRR